MKLLINIANNLTLFFLCFTSITSQISSYKNPIYILYYKVLYTILFNIYKKYVYISIIKVSNYNIFKISNSPAHKMFKYKKMPKEKLKILLFSFLYSFYIFFYLFFCFRFWLSKHPFHLSSDSF